MIKILNKTMGAVRYSDTTANNGHIGQMAFVDNPLTELVPEADIGSISKNPDCLIRSV